MIAARLLSRLKVSRRVPDVRCRADQTGCGEHRSRSRLAWLAFIGRVPALTLLLLIRVYQCVVAPGLPMIFGAACGCRFAPSCSHYAAEAIRVHGAFTGVVLAAIRLAKCSPLHPGGWDPVPPTTAKPRCERVLASISAPSL